jgi:hypothetical protein
MQSFKTTSINQVIQSILGRTHEENPIQVLINTEYLTRSIREHTEDQLFIVTDCGNGVKQVTQTYLATAVILTLAHCMKQFGYYFPIYTFNPYLDIFVRNAGTGGLIEKVQSHEALHLQNGVYQNDPQYSIFVDMAVGIDQFISHIRLELLSPWFKTLEYNAQRVSDQNFRGLQNYIDSLFTQYARLLVLRVDVGYQMDNIIQIEDYILTKYHDAKHDRGRFLTNMESNSLGEQMLGYVWKLEYGPDKGWHYHLLFIFDGSKVREDQTLAMLIGEYWKNFITQGGGSYHNCNAFKGDYPILGIGMINYYDLELIQGLVQAAHYLTKPDYYARALVPGNDRTFGRKEIPKPKDGNIGRPRSLGHETVS